MDLTAVTASITSSIVSITTLGLAVLSVVVAIKTFGWVRGAMK